MKTYVKVSRRVEGETPEECVDLLMESGPTAIVEWWEGAELHIKYVNSSFDPPDDYNVLDRLKSAKDFEKYLQEVPYAVVNGERYWLRDGVLSQSRYVAGNGHHGWYKVADKGDDEDAFYSQLARLEWDSTLGEPPRCPDCYSVIWPCRIWNYRNSYECRECEVGWGWDKPGQEPTQDGKGLYHVYDEEESK